MSALHLTLRAPGPPTCTFCGADDATLVLAGTRGFICDVCAGDRGRHTDLVPDSCALCGGRFGGRTGWLRRERREVALSRQHVAACGPCLAEAKRILARHRSPAGHEPDGMRT